MGRHSVEDVVRILHEAGFRTGRAYPGHRMPHIQIPSVAVAVQKEDVDALVMEITVLMPDIDGGAACEDVAMGVVQVLREHGIECVQEHCQHDGKGDRFTVRILATCKTPEPERPFAVFVNYRPMPYLVSLTVEQRMDAECIGAMGQSEPVGVITKQQPWELTVEERIPSGVDGPIAQEEPFELQIQRGVIVEAFDGGYWTSYYSHDDWDGLHVIRKGIAQVRRFFEYH